MLRHQATTLIRSQTRLFATTTIARNKGPVDQAKDAVKQVDRTISDAAVKGIDKGAEAAEAAKESVGIGAEKANKKAQDAKEKVAEEAKDKAKDLKGDAQQKK